MVGQGCSVPIDSLGLGLREELLGAKRIELNLPIGAAGLTDPEQIGQYPGMYVGRQGM